MSKNPIFKINVAELSLPDIELSSEPMSEKSIKRIVNQITNFYRRPLPSFCINFSSNEGKTIFKEAMNDGYMENYFKLASQFRTQDEPAFCGLATLVMVLNALEIDPGRIWKGPWRWYHEQMLDCCIPIDTIKTKGITFDQFACLSRCNGLEIGNERRLSEEIGMDKLEIDRFQLVVKEICGEEKGQQEVLVVSYSRAAVGQTGGGHFCAVGGFHRPRRLVLLMDTARFKYPPHWVPLELLWHAMTVTDGETGLGRGYMTLGRSGGVDGDSRQLLLGTAVEMNELLLTGAGSTGVDKLAPMSAFVRHWSDWINTRVTIDHHHHHRSTVLISDDGAHLRLVKDTAAAIFDWLLRGVRNNRSITPAPFALTCRTDLSDGVALGNRDIQGAIAAIVKDVLECPIGVAVTEVVSSLDFNDRKLLSDRIFLLPKLSGCSFLMLQDEIQKLTFLVSSWIMVASPVMEKAALNPVSATPTRGELLQHFCSKIIHSQMSQHSQNELVKLSNKIAKMYKYHDWKSSGRKESVCGAR